MTKQEAIKILESECYIADLLDLDRTRMVNTSLDIAIKALEKDIPKKPISKPDGFGLKIKVCPNCGTPVYDPDWTISTKKVYFTKRCQNCGQLFTKLGKYIGTWEDDK